MRKVYLRISLICLTLFGCVSVRPVLIDNNIDLKKEWADAKSTQIGDGYSILVKQDKFYYYVAINRIDDNPIYVDFYLHLNNKTYNIHASQQIGERLLEDTTWTDRKPEMKWGVRNGWTASVAIVDRIKLSQLRKDKVEIIQAYMQSILPYDGYEFQFLKESWNLKEAKIRIEIKHMYNSDEFKEVIYPLKSEKKSINTWGKFSSFI